MEYRIIEKNNLFIIQYRKFLFWKDLPPKDTLSYSFTKKSAALLILKILKEE